MSDIAIRVEGLSKLYRLGEPERYRTLRDTLTDALKAPFRRRRAGGAKRTEAETLWALKDVSFEVKHGEVIGIIGRNGAGKSTLLKILSRITEPTEGHAEIRGRVGSLLEVGTGFHPELSGRENIFLNGAILGMKKAEILRKFDEIVAFAEVEKFIDTPVKHYSSGMYVRLAFAVAAHMETDVLVVDEVLAVGDAAFQKKCLGRMSDAARGGRTVLFVSHNLGAVRSLCPRSVYLQSGELVADGPTNNTLELYSDAVQVPGSTLTKGFGSFAIESVVLRHCSGGRSLNFHAGEAMIVEIDYKSDDAIDEPYFWVEVYSQHGQVFAACMLFDGFRPKRIMGRGTVRCRFHSLPLMPGSYTIRLGARRGDGVELLMQSQEVAFFNMTGSMAAMGFHGQLAESLSVDAAPVILPYTWHLPDGQSQTFEVNQQLHA